ncbi:MAG: hypothetical protein JXA13_13255 [Anaerolineales bacterium]|nr:hypothetical protein [Anaerolineales bacterium]
MLSNTISPDRAAVSGIRKARLAQRFYLALLTLLGLVSILSIFLVILWIELGEMLQYRFLIKNLLLSWIPFISASLAYIASGERRGVIMLPV